MAAEILIRPQIPLEREGPRDRRHGQGQTCPVDCVRRSVELRNRAIERQEDNRLMNLPAPLERRGNSMILIALAAILLLGLYLRITGATGTKVIAPLRADAAEYFMYAYNLRYHRVYAPG